VDDRGRFLRHGRHLPAPPFASPILTRRRLSVIRVRPDRYAHIPPIAPAFSISPRPLPLSEGVGGSPGYAAGAFLNGTCPIAPLRARIRKPIPLSSRATPTTIPKREIALAV
jgi:hypothetical protein